MRQLWTSWALTLLLLTGVPGVARGAVAGETVAQGTHWRLPTPRGAIHVLRPRGYRRQGAGIVLHVHGFNTTVDRVWKTHRLAHQFFRSKQNALFVAVAGPRSLYDQVKFPSLARVLRRVAHQTGERLPRGPLVAVGHSAGYWTIVHWLDHRALEQVILLDGLYGFTADFHRWLGRKHLPRRRLVLVARGTRGMCRRFVRRYPRAARLPRVPRAPERFTRGQRTARVVYMDSQYGHTAMASKGRVIPVVLNLTRLQRRPEIQNRGR